MSPTCGWLCEEEEENEIGDVFWMALDDVCWQTTCEPWSLGWWALEWRDKNCRCLIKDAYQAQIERIRVIMRQSQSKSGTAPGKKILTWGNDAIPGRLFTLSLLYNDKNAIAHHVASVWDCQSMQVWSVSNTIRTIMNYRPYRRNFIWQNSHCQIRFVSVTILNMG